MHYASMRRRTVTKQSIKDDETVPPPRSGRGEIMLLTSDPLLAQQAPSVLRESGVFIMVAESLSALPGSMPTDVLVLDDSAAAPTILETLARVPVRPAVVVVLRTVDDLRLALRFWVGVVAIDAIDTQLGGAIDRARYHGRRPRLR
jgi:hypothetical protein